MSNRSDVRVSACFGPSKDVDWSTGVMGGAGLDAVDHPGCVQDFRVAAHGELVWSERLDVPDLAEIPVKTTVRLQVLNPRNCGSMGCSSISVKSNEFTVPGLPDERPFPTPN